MKELVSILKIVLNFSERSLSSVVINGLISQDGTWKWYLHPMPMISSSTTTAGGSITSFSSDDILHMIDHQIYNQAKDMRHKSCVEHKCLISFHQKWHLSLDILYKTPVCNSPWIYVEFKFNYCFTKDSYF